MKNFEVIGTLFDLPAGAEVRMECVCTKEEVSVEKDEEGKEIYILSKKIEDIDVKVDDNSIFFS